MGQRMASLDDRHSDFHCADHRILAPALELADYVQSYIYRDTHFADPQPRPFTVSLYTMMNFHLGVPFRIFEYASGRVRVMPNVIVAGPCDHRTADAVSTGRNVDFIVRFRPTGFFRLFGISPFEIRNGAYDGADVLGTGLKALWEQLSCLSNPLAMRSAVEALLLERLSDALAISPAQRALEFMLQRPQSRNLGGVARSVQLAECSLRRHFVTQLGVPPKRLQRMVRLQTVAGLKQQHPLLPWNEACLEAGYFDQSHFINEFRELTGSSPVKFMRELDALPKEMRHNYFNR